MKPRPPTMNERIRRRADRAADAERRPYCAIAFARALGIIALAAAFAAGCAMIFGSMGCAALQTRYYDPADVPAFAPDGTNKVSRAALVVHLTAVDPRKWGGWGGDCPGADADAAAVEAALRRRAIPFLSLSNEAATVPGVLAAADAVGSRVATGGLILLYFAGHGGQQDDFGGDEIDDADETLCLWDGPLADDTVWAMLQRVPAGVRVWLVTDCCNSGSNFRHGPAHDYARGVSRWWRSEPSMLHFGASRDGKQAWSNGKTGGFFTTALAETWAPGVTYADWFAAAKRAVQARKTSQTPVMNWTGDDFSNMEAWE